MDDQVQGVIMGTASPEAQQEFLTSTIPVFLRAHQLIATRGWGKGAYARSVLGRVTAGTNLKETHSRFSIGGAIILASLDEQKKRELTDEKTAAIFQQCLDGVVSVIYTSDMVEGDMKLIPINHRLQMAMSIVMSGQALPTVCGWNDAVVRDKAHAMAVVMKAHEMTMVCLEKLRAQVSGSGALQ